MPVVNVFGESIRLFNEIPRFSSDSRGLLFTQQNLRISAFLQSSAAWSEFPISAPLFVDYSTTGIVIRKWNFLESGLLLS